jgi:gliding motility-associated lipoprotein GldB
MQKCIFLVISLVFLFSCGGKNVPDVSNIEVNIQFIRFDQELETVKKDSASRKSLNELQKKYPYFAELYFSTLAKVATLNDTAAPVYIKAFLFDKDIMELHADVQQQFANLEDFKKEVTQAFKYYKYYLPQRIIPNVLTYNFGFNNVVVALDSTVCISLDQYLGKTSKYYEHLPDYIKYRKEKPYMVPDLLRGWISAEFDNGQPRTDMLDEMVYQGKIMYLVDKILPYTNDTIKWGYTASQMKFCKSNEFMMWSFFLEKKMLYSKDYKLINKYCGEAPFSAGMPDESPGRTGIWLGWKIVTAFMKNNKNITIDQLMMNNNSKQILNSSKYKPKK